MSKNFEARHAGEGQLALSGEPRVVMSRLVLHAIAAATFLFPVLANSADAEVGQPEPGLESVLVPEPEFLPVSKTSSRSNSSPSSCPVTMSSFISSSSFLLLEYVVE